VITGVLALLAVLVLAFVRVPLGFSMLIVSWVGLGLMNGWDSANTQVPLTITEAVFSYDLAVVPMFILMGNVLSRTGISDDLFRAAYAFLGSVRGGLALSTMVTCAGFSAVCGSSLATAATMSKVAYPSMKRYGYSEELATATIAAGGTLGILIPPSIILMIYGFLTQTNIGHLFIAGVLPGLVGLGLYMCAIMWVALRRPQEAPAGEPVPWPEKLASLRGVWPFALLFFLIIGGLYGAIFTATEAAGTSTMLYFVLFGAMLFAKLVAFSGLGEGLVDFMRSAGLGPYGTLFAVLSVFILLGCVMDTMAIILICVPLFLPTLAAHGFDLIWFGVIVVVLTEIGLITPPVGMNVFVLKACLQHVPLKTIFRGLIPFISADIVRLAILISFPSISLALVKMMK
jgi:TRAP-type C4-dicarboxylate transport system permease large subunit